MGCKCARALRRRGLWGRACNRGCNRYPLSTNVLFISRCSTKVSADPREKYSKALREVFGGFPFGVCELSLYGDRIISIDDQVCRITGYRRKELAEISMVDLPVQASLDTFFTRMLKILNGEEVCKTAIYRILAKSGEVKTLKTLLLEVLRDEDGYPCSTLVAYAEIPDEALMNRR